MRRQPDTRFTLAATALVTLLLGGCATPPPAAPPTADPPPVAPTPPERAEAFEAAAEAEFFSEHPLAPFGLPELDPDLPQPPATLVEHDGWAALHDDTDLIPLWVCQRLDAADTVGDADRDECNWKPDPLLAGGPSATDDDYTNSGYSRGHQAPANDYSFSQDETCETFLFANCAPQLQNGFNSGIWSTLEDRCQDAAVARGTVFIITGPMFYDPVDDEESPLHDATLDDDVVEFEVIGINRVAVPTHFYKIVIDATETTDPAVIAFVIENRRHTIEDDGPRFTETNTRPVRWIEDRTGIDFMPSLADLGLDPDAIETAPASFTLWPEFAPSD